MLGLVGGVGAVIKNKEIGGDMSGCNQCLSVHFKAGWHGNLPSDVK